MIANFETLRLVFRAAAPRALISTISSAIDLELKLKVKRMSGELFFYARMGGRA